MVSLCESQFPDQSKTSFSPSTKANVAQECVRILIVQVLPIHVSKKKSPHWHLDAKVEWMPAWPSWLVAREALVVCRDWQSLSNMGWAHQCCIPEGHHLHACTEVLAQQTLELASKQNQSKSLQNHEHGLSLCKNTVFWVRNQLYSSPSTGLDPKVEWVAALPNWVVAREALVVCWEWWSLSTMGWVHQCTIPESHRLHACTEVLAQQTLELASQLNQSKSLQNHEHGVSGTFLINQKLLFHHQQKQMLRKNA